MENLNERKKNSMELLIDAYNGVTQPITEEAVGDGSVEVPTQSSAVASREANVDQLYDSVVRCQQQIRAAGKELNQLPTDVSKRAFARYEDVDRAIMMLRSELTRLMNDQRAH